MRDCATGSCGRRVVAFGYCDQHYRRWRKTGDPGGPIAEPLTIEERFWVKVDKRGPDECWPWKARVLPNGYGVFYRAGRHDYAHRAAYELNVGPIPEGLTIDHVWACGCTRRDCVNPAHLEAVTQRENTLRSSAPSADQARQTHCIHGHEFTPENTYRHNGHRYCRACRADRRR